MAGISGQIQAGHQQIRFFTSHFSGCVGDSMALHAGAAKIHKKAHVLKLPLLWLHPRANRQVGMCRMNKVIWCCHELDGVLQCLSICCNYSGCMQKTIRVLILSPPRCFCQLEVRRPMTFSAMACHKMYH